MYLECLAHYECSVKGISGWWWKWLTSLPQKCARWNSERSPHLGGGWTESLKFFPLLRFYEFLKILKRIFAF